MQKQVDNKEFPTIKVNRTERLNKTELWSNWYETLGLAHPFLSSNGSAVSTQHEHTESISRRQVEEIADVKQPHPVVQKKDKV